MKPFQKVILLVVLSLCLLPAAAAAASTPEKPAAPQAPAAAPAELPPHLAFLADPAFQGKDDPSRPTSMSSCMVTLNCSGISGFSGTYPLSCSSASGNCVVGSNYVQCDGVRQNCPVCYKSCLCHETDCFGFSSCSGPGYNFIICDGQRFGCTHPC
ncbi:MAG TPA: hypothetical protein VOA87_14605 [Thermoanaerobaculia bacterium]|nr:hypothetical protein [Thermoanaerobaculia bacterium]